MVEFLHNLLPFVGAFVGSLGLAWTIAKFPRKRLQVEVLQAARVTERYSEAPDTIEWNGTEMPTKDVFEVLIDVQNIGNVAILSSDFERPLKLIFDADSVLFAEILEERPEDLRASLSESSNRVELEPLLLNAGDTIGIEVWMHLYKDVRVEGRVIGVQQLRLVWLLERFLRGGLASTIIVMVAIVIGFFMDFYPEILPPVLNFPILGFLLAGAVLTSRQAFKARAAYKRLQRKAEKQRVLHERLDQ